MVNITVAFATPEKQVEIPLAVEASCTIAMAIRRCGILQMFPNIRLGVNPVGINGRVVSLDDLVQENCRIEIYRPLTMDPKEARRRRHSTTKLATRSPLK